VEPIGVIHSPYRSVEEIPRCAGEKLDETARVEVFPEYAPGLRDVEGFSHLMLLAHLHEARDTKLVVHPPIDPSGRPRGVFATRSPQRPNHIAVSIVELEGVEGRTLVVRGIDLLDGTPLIDIKPYTPYDARTAIEVGWLEGIAISQEEDVRDGGWDSGGPEQDHD
jgi:tRNA-Thr(GGU) m(6)t(6)A37 methyltransferase TsaA